MGKKQQKNKGQQGQQSDHTAIANMQIGWGLASNHPVFSVIAYRASRYSGAHDNTCPRDGWAVVYPNGLIHAHPSRRAEPEEWAYVFAHCLLHLGFEHFRWMPNQKAWNAACDMYVARFLADLKFVRKGDSELPLNTSYVFTSHTEDQLYTRFVEQGIPTDALDFSTGGADGIDLILDDERYGRAAGRWGEEPRWGEWLAQGLIEAVSRSVDVAGGVSDGIYSGGYTGRKSIAEQARAWFINNYPLLGALAASFKIIKDQQLCHRMEISVAAVDAELREIYMNPAAGLNLDEAKFVMAHELLHVGLSHHTRQQGRDHYLWNVACDYVINSWLVEMGIGALPSFGLLYEPELKGLSAEAIYDRIVNDLRRYRKLATFRGFGEPDMLPSHTDGWWDSTKGMALDDFYRRCLAQGLVYHQTQGRGYFPAGLIEEIQALSQPPIPWDVELAQWFESHFPRLEKVRTYARPSRRQASTPDIPRPRYVRPLEIDKGRTFGVVLDTSGSMPRELLGKALGAIASYAVAHDVPAARVVFCDAVAYDAGYMPPEAIAERVRVKGRGGTILQPGVDLLQSAEDFPDDGPILIITDTQCDQVRVARDHAWLIPKGARLPFVPRGEVFCID
jgi:predicted metal-dependent peptidase